MVLWVHDITNRSGYFFFYQEQLLAEEIMQLNKKVQTMSNYINIVDVQYDRDR